MIKRYARDEMNALWSAQARFEAMLEVEKQIAKSQAELGIIPKAAAQAICSKARLDFKKIQKIEQKTHHDVGAFVQQVAESVGSKYGSYVHWGVTSSDVLDTALTLQIQRSGKILKQGFKSLDSALKSQIKSHKKTLCVGRTHGIHAEPLTFGYKLCGFLEELRRVQNHVDRALGENSYGQLSGAVGAYNTLPPQVEKKMCQGLKLKPELLSTQVLPRDRHASLIFSLSLLGAHLERLAIELRHLQRTEVSEVSEAFAKGQMGSSIMPHKKNPISAENLTGLARLLRSYSSVSLENISLWHERDISHSSAERVIFPDAFILADYALHRMAKLVKNLIVNKDQMLKNLELTQGQIVSSRLLSELVSRGLSRQKAYKWVQKNAHQDRTSFLKSIQEDKVIKKMFSSKELKSIFNIKVSTSVMEKKISSCLKR